MSSLVASATCLDGSLRSDAPGRECWQPANDVDGVARLDLLNSLATCLIQIFVNMQIREKP